MPSASKDARARFAPLVAHVAREWRRAVDGRLQAFGLTEATWLPLLRIARREASYPRIKTGWAAVTVLLQGSTEGRPRKKGARKVVGRRCLVNL